MKRAVAFVGENEAKDLKVAIAMKKDPPKTMKQDIRRSQRERGVPSSANWNPTNPLTRRQQYAAATRPV